MLRRQMYRRARRDLLLKRVLLADLTHHDNWVRAAKKLAADDSYNFTLAFDPVF